MRLRFSTFAIDVILIVYRNFGRFGSRFYSCSIPHWSIDKVFDVDLGKFLFKREEENSRSSCTNQEHDAG
ncbi:unnamed protein product [Amoebophrya sp. A120]|nr:unnamed protein product [Amoebophrya sp. A120]|eukprot:GSA120T00019597001.1